MCIDLGLFISPLQQLPANLSIFDYRVGIVNDSVLLSELLALAVPQSKDTLACCSTGHRTCTM